jgi:hypothetical protein
MKRHKTLTPVNETLMLHFEAADPHHEQRGHRRPLLQLITLLERVNLFLGEGHFSRCYFYVRCIFTFSKVLHIMTLYRIYTRELTFENLNLGAFLEEIRAGFKVWGLGFRV